MTAIDQVGSMLELRDIFGSKFTGREWVGVSHFQQWAKPDKTER